MLAGELFIQLGLAGADKLTKGLEQANKSLNQIKESGLEAARSLKDFSSQFSSQAQSYSNFGSILTKFEQSTGLSAETLQKFQKGLLGVGVNADETRSSMVQLQNIMNDIQRGKPIPQSMALALRKAGVDPTQIKDIYGFVDKLGGVAKSMDTAIGRSIFADLGLGSDMYQGLRRFQGDFANIKPSMSRGQYMASEQTSNLIAKYKFEVEAKLATILSGKDVNKAIDSIYRITLSFLELVKALISLSTQTKVFDLVIMSLKGIKMIIDAISEMVKSFSTDGVMATLGGVVGGIAEAAGGIGLSMREAITGEDYSKPVSLKDTSLKNAFKSITPTVKGSGLEKSPNVTNTTNTFNISNKDPKATADEVHRKLNPTTTYKNTQTNVKR